MSRLDELNKDNHIADFAEGKTSASSTDPELIHLEETILSLKRNLPTSALDSATAKQMLVRLKARIKREEEMPKIPFWKKLFDFQANPQIGMILAVTAVLILAIVTVPSLQFGGGTITGTASGTTNLLIIGGLITVILLTYWFSRRK